MRRDSGEKNLRMRPGDDVPPAVDPRRIPLWSLRDDVLVEVDPGGEQAVLLTRWGEVELGRPGRLVVEALRRMSFGPVLLDNVVAGGPQRRRLAELLDGLQDVLVRSLGTEDGMGPLLSVVPVARYATFRPRPAPDGQPIRLSRSASLHSEDDALVLESPLAVHRVALHQPVARAVTAVLGGATTAGAVAAALRLPTGLVVDLAGYLIGTGLVVPATPDEPPAGSRAAAVRTAEDVDPGLLLWSHHGLLFHVRS